MDSTPNDNKKANKLKLFQIAASVLAAFFGVQSKTNKERDFKQGNFKSFVIGGIIFTLLFLLTLFFVVQQVTS